MEGLSDGDETECEDTYIKDATFAKLLGFAIDPNHGEGIANNLSYEFPNSAPDNLKGIKIFLTAAVPERERPGWAHPEPGIPEEAIMWRGNDGPYELTEEVASQAISYLDNIIKMIRKSHGTQDMTLEDFTFRLDLGSI